MNMEPNNKWTNNKLQIVVTATDEIKSINGAVLENKGCG